MQFVEFFAVRLDTGQALPNAQCTVYLTGTGTPASLFDATGAPISNPVTADISGKLGFAAVNGTYDYVIVGGGYTQTIEKQYIFDLSAVAQALAAGTVAGMVSKVKDTKANLNADLAAAANTLGLVYADPTPSNNDLYVKVGASGSGSWTGPLGIVSSQINAYVASVTSSAAAAHSDRLLADADAAAAHSDRLAADGDAAAAHADRLLADADVIAAAASASSASSSAGTASAAAAGSSASAGSAAGSASTASADAAAAHSDRLGAEAAEAGVLSALAGTSLSSATLMAADRTILAALNTSLGLAAWLDEDGRTGMFDIVIYSGLTTAQQADANGGINIEFVRSTFDSSKAWRRRHDGAIDASWAGARGDGVTNDTLALAAVASLININGGGDVILRPGAVYLVGLQSFFSSPIATFYNWYPTNYADFTGTGDNSVSIMKFVNCTKPVNVYLNGATFRTAPGLKYGVFNDDGTPKATSPGYLGVGAATPFYHMIQFYSCTGGGSVRSGELDGNIGALPIGGGFSDTGIQLPYSGFYQHNCMPAIIPLDLDIHHFGLDGIGYDGPATGYDAAFEQFVAERCNIHNCGRNNVSVTGGRGGEFKACSIYQAAKNCVGSNGVSVHSAPASGIDFEAEAGKIISDWKTDERCAIYDNLQQAIVADSGPSKRFDFRGYIHSGDGGYSMWLNKPNIKVRFATVQGTVLPIYNDAANPQDMPKFDRVTFSNDPALAPSGSITTINGHLFEGGLAGNDFANCVFDKVDSALGGGGNVNGPRYIDCEFVNAGAESARFFGRYSGHNRFVITGSGNFGLPGGANSTADVGPADGSYSLRSGGVTTEFAATIDQAGNNLATLYTALDADFAFTAGTDWSRIFVISQLTANRTWTVNASAPVGSEFLFTRTAASTGAFNANIAISGGGATLKALAAGTWCKVRVIDSTHGWQLVEAGTL